MVPDIDLQRWQHAINGITASQNELSSEELSAFQALVTLIDSGNFEASESSDYIRTLQNCTPQNGLLKNVHLTNFTTLCETHFHPPIPVIIPPPKTSPETIPKAPVEEASPEAPSPKRLQPVFEPPSFKKNTAWSNDADAQKITRKRPKPFTWIIIAGIAVLLGCGAAFHFIVKNKSQKEEVIQAQTDIKPIDKLPADTAPADTTTVISKQPVEQQSGRIRPSYPLPTKNDPVASATDIVTFGTIFVSGGSYTGALKNGQPHGQGTITYNRATLIDPRDMKQRHAEAGQSITGRFKDGRLIQGKLCDSEGNLIETIIIGGGAH